MGYRDVAIETQTQIFDRDNVNLFSVNHRKNEYDASLLGQGPKAQQGVMMGLVHSSDVFVFSIGLSMLIYWTYGAGWSYI
ncbi:MAG: hypothetical protein ACI87E_001094 [Mariniblastus sp.]